MEISPGYHPRNQVKMMHTPVGVVDSSRLSNTPAGVDRLLLQVPGVIPCPGEFLPGADRVDRLLLQDPGVIPPADFQKPSGFPRRSALIFAVAPWTVVHHVG